MYIYKNYKTRAAILEDQGLKEDLIFAYDGRLYKKLVGQEYRPLKSTEYVFMCDIEVRHLTELLGLVWYKDERVFSNNYYKLIEDILYTAEKEEKQETNKHE